MFAVLYGNIHLKCLKFTIQDFVSSTIEGRATVDLIRTHALHSDKSAGSLFEDAIKAAAKNLPSCAHAPGLARNCWRQSDKFQGDISLRNYVDGSLTFPITCFQ